MLNQFYKFNFLGDNGFYDPIKDFKLRCIHFFNDFYFCLRFFNCTCLSGLRGYTDFGGGFS